MPAIPAVDPTIRLSLFHERSSQGERYLVEVGNACFVVSRALHDVIETLRDDRPPDVRALGAALERRTGQSTPDETLSHVVDNVLPRALFDRAKAEKQRTPFLIRTTLLRSHLVEPIALRLAPLFAKPIVLTVLAAATVITALAFPGAMRAVHTNFTVREVAWLYLAVFLTGLWHELGHAAACMRHGAPPGDIGFGLYFVFPAFYSDVTKAWRLQPRARMVVDLGGLYFQSMVLTLVGIGALATGELVLQRFLWVTVFTMLMNLNPVFKLDGYWLFSDWTGLTNLHKRMRESFIARVRRRDSESRVPARLFYPYMAAVVAYAAYLIPFLVLGVRAVAARYPGEAAALIREAMQAPSWDRAAWAIARLAGASIWPLILAIALTSLTVRLVRLLNGLRT
jgi:putative peptide zinc metalloprotease protein